MRVKKYSSFKREKYQNLDLDENFDKFVQSYEGWVPQFSLKPRNNNKLVAYQWIRGPGIKEHPTEGPQDVLQSDFSRAQKCAICGRKIVHVFWIADETGIAKPYGIEHVHTALGIPTAIPTSRIDKIVEEMVSAKRQYEYRKKELLARASEDITKANKYFQIPENTSRPFRNMRHNDNVSAVFEKDGKYLRIFLDNKQDLEIVKELGFVEVPEEKKLFNIYSSTQQQ